MIENLKNRIRFDHIFIVMKRVKMRVSGHLERRNEGGGWKETINVEGVDRLVRGILERTWNEAMLQGLWKLNLRR